MGQRNVGDGLDFCHLQYPQIGSPLVEPIKRIVAGSDSHQELVPEEKRLRNYGADTARSEQADQGSKEMDEKNHQVAH
jgi:hypothetical protein